jgi:hypothetical protein
MPFQGCRGGRPKAEIRKKGPKGTRSMTLITHRRLDRPLAAKPSSDHPGTSNTQRLAAVRVHQLVTHPHFRVPMNMVSRLDSTSDSFSTKLCGPGVSAFRGIRYCERPCTESCTRPCTPDFLKVLLHLKRIQISIVYFCQRLPPAPRPRVREAFIISRLLRSRRWGGGAVTAGED